jgi:hypothetical protein
MTINMVGRIDLCLLLAYRTPAESVRGLLPRGLKPLTHGDWAFWNIVACHVDRMRPAGTPRCLGSSYYHVAYRLYAQARVADGAEVDGLFFVHSNADRASVCVPGNLVTDFRFHQAAIAVTGSGRELSVAVDSSGSPESRARCRIKLSDFHAHAGDSCFSSPADAEAVLHYRPLGLSSA